MTYIPLFFLIVKLCAQKNRTPTIELYINCCFQRFIQPSSADPHPTHPRADSPNPRLPRPPRLPIRAQPTSITPAGQKIRTHLLNLIRYLDDCNFELVNLQNWHVLSNEHVLQIRSSSIILKLNSNRSRNNEEPTSAQAGTMKTSLNVQIYYATFALLKLQCEQCQASHRIQGLQPPTAKRETTSPCQDWLNNGPNQPSGHPQSKMLVRTWKKAERMGKNQFSIEIFVCKF